MVGHSVRVSAAVSLCLFKAVESGTVSAADSDGSVFLDLYEAQRQIEKRRAADLQRMHIKGKEKEHYCCHPTQ